MSDNGEIAIDLDSPIVERVDRFYQDDIEPYRAPYQPLCDAVDAWVQKASRRAPCPSGHRYRQRPPVATSARRHSDGQMDRHEPAVLTNTRTNSSGPTIRLIRENAI